MKHEIKSVLGYSYDQCLAVELCIGIVVHLFSLAGILKEWVITIRMIIIREGNFISGYKGVAALINLLVNFTICKTEQQNKTVDWGPFWSGKGLSLHNFKHLKWQMLFLNQMTLSVFIDAYLFLR